VVIHLPSDWVVWGEHEFHRPCFHFRRRLNFSAAGVFLLMMKRETKLRAGVLLAAAGLTSSLVWFAVDSSSSDTNGERVRSGRESTVRREPGQLQETSFPRENNLERDGPLQANDGTRVSGAVENETTEALPGVRLADDFPLPAAIVSNYRNGNRERSSPQLSRAEEDIAARFYSEVALQVAGTNGTSAVEPVEEAEGPTIIISPGADSARTLQRANERYRALFGNEAYNQASMESTKDARLSMPLEMVR
jgi:hypothetical protein